MYNKIVCVRGFNIPKLLKEVDRCNIKLLSIKRAEHKELEFEISSKEYKKLIDLPLFSCYTIISIKNKPTKPFLSALILRSGIIVGSIIACLFLISFCSKIWVININLDEQLVGVTEAEIYEILALSNTQVGSKLISSTRTIEKEILKAIPDASVVIAHKNGINLDIYIKAGQKKQELSKTNIVSNYNGVITDINLVSGKLVVNKGEGVTKGQVLISAGYEGDFYAEAIGELKAKTLVSGCATGATKSQSVKRTGRIMEFYNLELFGKRININYSQEEVDANFKLYEMEEQSSIIFNNFLLPVKKTKIIIYELEETEVVKTQENLIFELKEDAYKDAKNSLPSGAKEEKVTYDVFNQGELIKVICNIETEIVISVRSE